MLEAAFQTKVIHKLKSQGCWVFNVHGHSFQRAGIPDLLVCHKRWKGFMELKTKTHVDPLQKLEIRELKKTGFPAFVVKLDKDEMTVLVMDEDEHLIEKTTLDGLLECVREISRPSHLKAWLWFLQYIGVEPSQKSIAEGMSVVGATIGGQEVTFEFVGNNEDIVK